MDGDFNVVWWDRGEALLNQRLCCLRPTSRINPRFLYYALPMPLRVINDLTYFTTVKHLSSSQVAAVRLPLPPVSRQRAIAEFLDRRTAAIDAVIAKRERLLELLAQKRSAIISTCVIGAASGPIRDSGLPWLGTIPASWRVVRLSYVASVVNGSTPSRDREDYWTGGTVPWLSSGKVNEFVVREADEFITEQARCDAHLRVLPAGTVLVGMVGQGKTRGMSALMALDACINQNAAGVTPGPELDPQYLHFVLVHAYQPLRELGQGGQQDALNCATIKAFRIPLPPIAEQRRLVQTVERDLAAVDALAGALAKQVSALREYRRALISGAVLGRLEVAAEPREAA